MKKQQFNITKELEAKCGGDNQFENFERVFRSIMAVPKAEVLRLETKT